MSDRASDEIEDGLDGRVSDDEDGVEIEGLDKVSDGVNSGVDFGDTDVDEAADTVEEDKIVETDEADEADEVDEVTVDDEVDILNKFF